MVPVGQGVRREYQNMFQSFTCCVGTGMENHALHGFGLYYASADRLWVNLYAPSTADWAAAGVKLAMDTTFPEGDAATLTSDGGRAEGVHDRAAASALGGRGVHACSVNGEAVKTLPGPAPTSS